MKFQEYKKLDLPQLAADVLALWDKDDTFKKSIETMEGHPSFVFFEGPPSANGMPGIHHVMARTIKDVICRYKTQCGYRVLRKAGWDTHGLPVELGVEKTLGIKKEDIGVKISVDDYNRACRKDVMKYTSFWSKVTRQMGYWVNLDDPYITYDNKYIETLWYLLKELYKKGLLYKGYTIQPYSPAAGTGLSSHELNQPGCYRDVKDTTVTALFEISDAPEAFKGWGRACIAAWTTTPWTLPSNTALCIGPKIQYSLLDTFNPYNGEKISVVIATERISAYYKEEGLNQELVFDSQSKIVPYHVRKTFLGEELVGLHYKQLMPWVKPIEKVDENAPEYVTNYAEKHPDKCFTYANDKFVEISEEAFRVIAGDYVTTEDGTGIVHIAPTFGADDQRVAKAAGIPALYMINRLGETRPMVDFSGKYFLCEELSEQFVERCVNRELYAKHEGAFVKNAYDPKYNEGGRYDEARASKEEDLNIFICLEMKAAGEALKIEKHVHNYPHCWRTDKPVLYYPLDSWFIRASSCRERMMELNATINWQPESTGSGRFGRWLENLNDWNLSRSRFWGTPLPIWKNRDSREEICIGSVEELYDEIEKSVKAGLMKENPYRKAGFVPGDMSQKNYDKIDLHRPYVDDIVLVSKTGNPLYREKDLIDVWFDSGAMPYAQLHYPFENKQKIDSGEAFPADFIAEGVDQTRGWFYTLHAIATMLFDSVAFRNIISNGLVLDKNGDKMSKRLGNAVDPFEVLDKYGADATRWYMISNSDPWDNLRFNVDGVEEVRRKFFSTLYNTYSFFALYANIDGFTGKEEEVPIERRPEIDRWILSLLNTLTKNVRESLDRFDPTPAARYIQDFVSENLSNWYVRLCRKRYWGGDMNEDKLSAYQTLYTCLETVSMLAAPFAPFISDRIFMDLNEVSGRHQGSVHLCSFPVDTGIEDKPLEDMMSMAQRLTSMVLALRKKVNIKVRQPLARIMVPVLSAEQKKIMEAASAIVRTEVNVKDVEIISETSGLITKRIKPNFKTLGPRYGKYMKQIAALTATFSQERIQQIEKSDVVELDLGTEKITILPSDFEITSDDMPGWLVASDAGLTVALDVTITDELREEGVAREIINRIQNLRKNCGFDVTDKIKVEIEDVPVLHNAVALYADYIASQTLAVSVKAVSVPNGTFVMDHLDKDTLLTIYDEYVKIAISHC
ncbi:MAG: isoleucine--tRNA ligase [Alistipes sp.]|nr:isoleucine--tRNA ligase [Candidatus Alistipes equi]